MLTRTWKKQLQFPVTITIKINILTTKKAGRPPFQSEDFRSQEHTADFPWTYIFLRTKEHMEGANTGPQIMLEPWSTQAPLLQKSPTKKPVLYLYHGNHLVGSCFPPKPPCASASNGATAFSNRPRRLPPACSLRSTCAHLGSCSPN